jgi:hypothetical protein
VSDIAINEPTSKRRNGPLLTDRLCETRVAKRVKYYDRKCRGLYVSITPAGVATFSCNFTNAAGRPTSSTIGIHHPELFKVADARAKVSALKAKGGSAISEILCQQKSEANRRGVTVQRDELNATYGTVDIPARRVKKRRVINQPLSDLALEILTESMGNHDFAFAGRFGDAPLARQAMSGALKGTKHRNGKVKTPGICELLGIAPFTLHDLRRTAATMCGNLGLSESAISQCLDH